MAFLPLNRRYFGIQSGIWEGLDLDVDKMLAELRLEREQIEEAILTLERLARGRGRRRGRPPGWLKDAASSTSFMTEEGLGGLEDLNGNGHISEPKRRGRPPKVKPKVEMAAEA
jgi:hypothetical protein